MKDESERYKPKPKSAKRKKRCEVCAFWQRDLDDYRGVKHTGYCNSKKMVYCGDETAMADLDGLEFWDVESYGGGLKTGEDFCCCHFVKKKVRR